MAMLKALVATFAEVAAAPTFKNADAKVPNAPLDVAIAVKAVPAVVIAVLTAASVAANRRPIETTDVRPAASAVIATTMLATCPTTGICRNVFNPVSNPLKRSRIVLMMGRRLVPKVVPNA